MLLMLPVRIIWVILSHDVGMLLRVFIIFQLLILSCVVSSGIDLNSNFFFLFSRMCELENRHETVSRLCNHVIPRPFVDMREEVICSGHDTMLRCNQQQREEQEQEQKQKRGETRWKEEYSSAIRS